MLTVSCMPICSSYKAALLCSGIKIPGLRDKLVKIVHNNSLTKVLKDGCRDVLQYVFSPFVVCAWEQCPQWWDR